MDVIERFRRSESGATAVEYGIILAIIATFIIGSMVAFRDAVSNNFASIEEAIGEAIGA
jgi:pilus assembly protein Flp/PilA